jgi:hypothetical protein
MRLIDADALKSPICNCCPSELIENPDYYEIMGCICKVLENAPTIEQKV